VSDMAYECCQQRRVASAQVSHCYALVPCPVTLPALLNVLAVGEDPANSQMRVAVVTAISSVVFNWPIYIVENDTVMGNAVIPR